MRRFVQAHVVPVSPWIEGEKVETLDGGAIWWESKDGVKMVGFSGCVRGIGVNCLHRSNQGI